VRFTPHQTPTSVLARISSEKILEIKTAEMNLNTHIKKIILGTFLSIVVQRLRRLENRKVSERPTSVIIICINWLCEYHTSSK
jgi:hypothetical protein